MYTFVSVKSFITYCLLLSFFVLLTPRDIWHECEHHAVEHHDMDPHHSSTDPSFEDGNCNVCDFDLGFVTRPSFVQFTFDKQVFVNRLYTVFSFFTKDKFQQFTHRGPPTV